MKVDVFNYRLQGNKTHLDAIVNGYSVLLSHYSETEKAIEELKQKDNFVVAFIRRVVDVFEVPEHFESERDKKLFFQFYNYSDVVYYTPIRIEYSKKTI